MPCCFLIFCYNFEVLSPETWKFRMETSYFKSFYSLFFNSRIPKELICTLEYLLLVLLYIITNVKSTFFHGKLTLQLRKSLIHSLFFKNLQFLEIFLSPFRSKVVKVCFKRKRFYIQIRPDWVSTSALDSWLGSVKF